MFKSNSILTGCLTALLVAGCSLTMGDMTLTSQKTSGGEDGNIGGKFTNGGGAGTAPKTSGGTGQVGTSGSSSGGRANGGASANGGVANGAATNGGVTNNAGMGNSATSNGGTMGLGGSSLGGASNGGAAANGGVTAVGGNVAAGSGATGVGGVVTAGGTAAGGLSTGGVANVAGMVGNATGGAATGGVTAAGGVATGGATATGGAATGGSGTGGAAPVPVVKSIALGSYHSCALYDNGTAKCWGWNDYGQLGNGSITSSEIPLSVSGLSNAKEISAGRWSTCALLTDNTVKCWGRNNAGQLGNGDNTVATSPVPVPVVNLASVTNMVVGIAHACAIVSGGQTYCWGSNDFGELGIGTTSTIGTYSPVAVQDVATANRLAASFHSCITTWSGSIQCWGFNYAGELGDGTKDNQSKPVDAAGITRATAIVAGGGHTCATLNTQAVQCWGENGLGQLGNGANATSVTPVAVSDLAGVTMIASELDFTCALTLASGISGVKCWGANPWGQLGDGTASDTGSSTPVTVKNVDSVTGVATGFHHGCALRSNGKVVCWGRNNYGQLGNGNKNDSLTAVGVTGL